MMSNLNNVTERVADFVEENEHELEKKYPELKDMTVAEFLKSLDDQEILRLYLLLCEK
jgi:hypothetical protein